MTEQLLVYLLPEVCLVLLATWFFVSGTIPAARSGLSLVAIAGLFVVLLGFYRQDSNGWFGQGAPTRLGVITVDSLAHVCRWAAVLLALTFLLMTYRRQQSNEGEFLGCAILAFVGFMIVSSAADMVLLFLGLELISIPTYVLLLIERRGSAPIEATVKYFFLSVFSSAIFLYGLSFLYGVGGSTSLADLQISLRENVSTDLIPGLPVLPLGMVLVLLGLAFKIAAVPFHFYAPDVYQATSNANAGLLAVLPKAAGIVALIRIVVVSISADSNFGWQIVVIVSMVTMTWGNVCALWQRNLRRMLAYSSIAHAGYLLVGVSVSLASSGEEVGYSPIGATLFYLAAYSVASLGAFAALTFLSSKGKETSQLEELSGIWKSHPWIAASLAVMMFSLSGIPPFAGFWGKWTLFSSAIGFAAATGNTLMKVSFIGLSVVAAVNAAIAAGYYLRVVATMFFEDGAIVGAAGAKASSSERSLGPGLATLLCMLVVLIAGAFPGRVISGAAEAGDIADLTGITVNDGMPTWRSSLAIGNVADSVKIAD